jgi:hypothetical protein
VTLSILPDLFYFCLADGNGLKQSRDFFEDALHAQAGIDDGVDFVMVRARVHD